MFSLKRNKKNEIILKINFNLIDLLISFFVNLNQVFASKRFYLIPMGLGIGFGLGITIFSNPNKISAQNEIAQIISQQIIPEKILIKNINFTGIINKQNNFSLLPINWQEDLVYFSNFNSKQHSPLVVASKEDLVTDLNLGNEIIITAKNKGQYKYKITQTKLISTKDFYSATEDTNAKIIIISSSNFVGTNLYLAFGK